MRRAAVVSALAALLGACSGATPAPMLGTLEWDRIELTAESAEPVLEIGVREGDAVAAGALLLRLDDRRARAELAQAEAELARLAALLDEARNGARPEAIAESRARLARAQSLARNAQQDLARVADMRARKLSTPSDFDRAQAGARAAQAEQAAAAAALEQLLAGTRIEALAQAEAAVAAAQARRDMVAIGVERMTLRAPRAARVDAIPVEVGDQPARGATLITLLVGEAPHARVFVPERARAGLQPGASFTVNVEGSAQALPGRLRMVRAEPTFTPYYALAGDDASRLSYIAEIELGEAAHDLPAGLPLSAVVQPAAP
jgi:HlyD family secretion protein